MPDLLHSLQNRDLGHLRIVAELWGVDLRPAAPEAAREELAAALLDPELAREMVDSLPAEARAALAALVEAGGRLPWAAFTRRFGELRQVGPARRDREQVWLHPISAAETLFYRALLARAFFDTPSGPQEFAFLPDDLLPLLKGSPQSPDFGAPPRQQEPPNSAAPLGRPATPQERARLLPASDRLLDDAVTLLAALRMGIDPPETIVPVNGVADLLRAANILVGNEPQTEAVKTFLETPRREALCLLANAWRESETFNELRQIPGLVFEGEWTNSPRPARHFLLALLGAIPAAQWWSLPAFVRAVKETSPDFQRPAGDYDSWFIKRSADGLYLRGFEHWEEVDGALIRYLISGPMFWLGMVELAMPEGSEVITAFRMASNVKRPMPDARHSTFDETGRLHVSSQGTITVPRSLPRAVRYQISRFCEWNQAKPDEYRYRLTPASLSRAAGQGLKVSQLLTLLAKNAAVEIPPAFVRALKRWEMNGAEARLETQTVLRLARPEVLDELRKSKAGRFLGEILGPTAVVVKPGAASKVLSALAEMGLLAEEQTPHAGGTFVTPKM